MADVQTTRERNKEWMRKYRATPKGKAANRAAKQKFYATERGKETRRIANKRWKKSENGKAYNREWARENYFYPYHIRSTYGLTLEQYEAMAAVGCAICGRPQGEAGGKNNILHVDHNHKTGKIRGLLCHFCNRGLGCFRDDQEFLQKAIEYLKRTNEDG
jgi:hypothetical protein